MDILIDSVIEMMDELKKTQKTISADELVKIFLITDAIGQQKAQGKSNVMGMEEFKAWKKNRKQKKQ